MTIIFTIKQGEETLTSHSGLALIGALLARTKLQERLNQINLAGCHQSKISQADMIFAMLGLICLGKPDYDAIESYFPHPFLLSKIIYFGQVFFESSCSPNPDAA